MAEKQDDKRKSPRAFFTFEENVSAMLRTSTNGSAPTPVTLLSIGTGGLSFTGDRQHVPDIHVGDHLVFSNLDGDDSQSLDSIDRLEGDVRYVMDNEGEIRVVVGCEFSEMNEIYLDTIHSFLKTYFNRMGFYLDD